MLVFSPEEWKAIKKALPNAIRESLKSVPAGGKKSQERKIGLALRNLNVLNRVSLDEAFQAYCKHYGVDLSDLWPETSGTVSLSKIRNHLAHGEAILDAHVPPIVVAHLNLQWTVERMILGLMGWPVKSSRVAQGSVRVRTSWQESQAMLHQLL